MDSVDEMLGEIASGAPPSAPRVEPQGPGPAGYQIQKVRYSHDSCIDIIIQNPWVSQNQLAAHFGYSPSWISIVMASDLFKARLEARREEVIDPVLRASLRERFQAVMETSLLRLQEKLSAPSPPDNLVLKAVELGAKAFGLGGGAGPQVVVNLPPPDRLTGLADRIVELQRRARRDSSAEVYEAPAE